MPELPVGSRAGYQNHLANSFDIGIVSDRSDRSYTITTESGKNISRNHIDLKWTKAPFEAQPHPVMSRIAKLHTPSNNPNTNVKHSGKANLIKKRVEVRQNNSECTYKMCSGHILRPTTR